LTNNFLTCVPVPWITGGGEMIADVCSDHSTYTEPPSWFVSFSCAFISFMIFHFVWLRIVLDLLIWLIFCWTPLLVLHWNLYLFEDLELWICKVRFWDFNFNLSLLAWIWSGRVLGLTVIGCGVASTSLCLILRLQLNKIIDLLLISILLLNLQFPVECCLDFYWTKSLFCCFLLVDKDVTYFWPVWFAWIECVTLSQSCGSYTWIWFRYF